MFTVWAHALSDFNVHQKTSVSLCHKNIRLINSVSVYPQCVSITVSFSWNLECWPAFFSNKQVGK